MGGKLSRKKTSACYGLYRSGKLKANSTNKKVEITEVCVYVFMCLLTSFIGLVVCQPCDVDDVT